MSSSPKRYPRQGLALLFFLGIAWFNFYISVFAYLLFNIGFRLFRLEGWSSIVFLILFVIISFFSGYHLLLSSGIKESFLSNVTHLFVLLHNDNKSIVNDVLQGRLDLNVPLFKWFVFFVFGGVATAGFWACGFVANNKSERKQWVMRKKSVHKESKDKKEISVGMLDSDDDEIGVSLTSGRKVRILDEVLNQILLIVGTTGGGKTVTLNNFYRRTISKGFPLIIVDGKADHENVLALKSYAESLGRCFYGFCCTDNDSYDYLNCGTPTEIKDKIISLKNESDWDSDYYRTQAEVYLQTAIEVLQRADGRVTLENLIDVLDVRLLANKVRSLNDKGLQKKVVRISEIKAEDLKGIQNQLILLAHSDLGAYLSCKNGFTLTDVVKNNGIAYFSLPALRYPSFSKVLGRLVINDIKTVLSRHNGGKVFCVFDEFSVFAGEQVLNLINMGRGLGAHTILGTQGLADLSAAAGDDFKKQLLNCVNSLLIHRVNESETAECLSGWIGTKNVFKVTSQVDAIAGDVSGIGSVRQGREFIVHPDTIKQTLNVGEAFYCTKVSGFLVDKIRVNNPL